MIEIINKLKENLLDITSAQVALLSVAVTLFLFFLGKKKENELKSYEIRKENYTYLLNLFKELFVNADGSKASLSFTKEQFYDVGSSLAIYGSKKLYNKYRLYREIVINENIQKLKFYDETISLFLFGEMYQLMRKEIGLNKDLIKINVPSLMVFFLNDITQPENRKKYYQYKYKVFKIQTLMFINKIDSCLFLSWILNCIIKPIFLVISMFVYIIF